MWSKPISEKDLSEICEIRTGMVQPAAKWGTERFDKRLIKELE
jgi:hypothetical protein